MRAMTVSSDPAPKRKIGGACQRSELVDGTPQSQALHEIRLVARQYQQNYIGLA
jgi:hypothetical protein